MSDTPRTDASWYYAASYDASEQVVKADFARQLERENALLIAANSDVHRIAMERDELERELSAANLRIVELENGIRNLKATKGRHNTGIAYEKLINLLHDHE